MDDECDDVVNVEKEGGAQPEEIIDEDKDLVAHPEWKWIAREPRRMALEITSTSLNVFTIVRPGISGLIMLAPIKRSARLFTDMGLACTSLFLRSSD
jgi:hypothetical protein